MSRGNTGVHALLPLTTEDSWRTAVGARNFKKNYSAHSCYVKWHGVTERLPDPLNTVLNNSKIDYFLNLQVRWLIAEHPTFLDSLKTPSRTDMMVFATNNNLDKIVVAVEAKAKETFAERVCRWIRTADAPKRREQRRLFYETPELNPRKIKRLDFLNSVLGTKITPDSELRYQLLHRSTAALREASNISASAALVVIQAFGEPNLENALDYADFLFYLGLCRPKKNQVLGPYYAALNSEMPLYFLYLQDSISSMNQTLF